MRAVTNHAFPFKGSRLGEAARDALRRFIIFLSSQSPESCSLHLIMCGKYLLMRVMSPTAQLGYVGLEASWWIPLGT